MRMFKALAICLIIVLAVGSLSGCAKKNGTTDGTNTNNTGTTSTGTGTGTGSSTSTGTTGTTTNETSKGVVDKAIDEISEAGSDVINDIGSDTSLETSK